MLNTYIIAEIGINHNGSIDNAFKLIKAAADAGCSAAKFQLFSADRLYPKSAGKLSWKNNNKQFEYDIYAATKEFELPKEWVKKLIEYCNAYGIEFISSVFDEKGLEFLIENEVKMIKLSSYTITHLPLIEACAKTGLPIIMSTGGATLAETCEAVQTVMKYHNRLKLLHCNLLYPADLNKCHLGVIETFKTAFPGILVGYSDHTEKISDAAVQSVYIGGSVVEKHITLNKKMDGSDHFFALEPHELKQMVTDICEAEKDLKQGDFIIDPLIYGSSAKICHDHEKYLRDFAYMTIFAGTEIQKGDIIRPGDVLVLRSGKKSHGLEPKYLSLFKSRNIIAQKALDAEEPINWDVILPCRPML